MNNLPSLDNLPKEIRAAIGNIRPVSPYLFEIIDNADLENLTILDLARRISVEPVLSARVIEATQAAAYGLSKKVESVFQAVPLLGGRRVIEIIVAGALTDSFGRAVSTLEFDLWEHSLMVAYAVQSILRELRMNVVPMARGFTTGLLHDVGRLVLYQCLKGSMGGKDIAAFSEVATNGKQGGVEWERARFGMSHDEIGACLAREWSMPEEMVLAIAHHHETDERRFPNGLTRLLIWSHVLVDSSLTTDEKKVRLPFSIFERHEELLSGICMEVENLAYLFSG